MKPLFKVGKINTAQGGRERPRAVRQGGLIGEEAVFEAALKTDWQMEGCSGEDRKRRRFRPDSDRLDEGGVGRAETDDQPEGNVASASNAGLTLMRLTGQFLNDKQVKLK